MKMWFQWGAFGSLLRLRARPVARMVLISFLTTIIVAVGFWLGMATWLDIQRMGSDVTMDVFVQDGVTDSTLAAHVALIASLPGVSHVQFDDGDRVWALYRERIRVSGDDLAEVVQLPHRIRITMTPRGTTEQRMTETEDLVTKIVGSDLVRVVWAPELIERLTHRREEFWLALIVGASLFLLLLMVSVVYSFRAEVHHAGTDLAVGAVLGAAPSTTAFPHFLLCASTAIVGAGFACLVVVLARPFILERAAWFGTVPTSAVLYVVLAVMAALITEGWLLTYTAARKSARHGKADRAT